MSSDAHSTPSDIAKDAEGLSDTASLASLDLIYESEDARFALFEIFDGHLAAVDASKLV